MQFTRRGFMALAGMAALGLAGCSGAAPENSAGAQSNGDGAEVKTNEPAPLEIVESGYSVTDIGYVMYGVALKNPNKGYEAQFPTFTITGRASDGSITFSNKQTCFVIFPGETVYYGFQAGNGTAPATVEFAVQEPKWIDSSPLEGEVFAISNTSEIDNGYGSTSFTGEITSNVSIDTETFRKVALTVITRDDAGAINYGHSTFSEIPAEGQTAPFEISAYGVPAHVSYEIYAQLW